VGGEAIASLPTSPYKFNVSREYMKPCNICKDIKEDTDFHTGRAKCKSCHNEERRTYYRDNEYKYRAYRLRTKDRSAVWRRSNKDKLQKYQKDWTSTPDGKATQLLHAMVRNADNKGFDAPEWERDEIADIILDGICDITGLPFQLTNNNSPRNPFAPSPDRIDNTKGYTKENTQWVCYIYNAMKSDFIENDVNIFINALTTVEDEENEIIIKRNLGFRIV